VVGKNAPLGRTENQEKNKHNPNSEGIKEGELTVGGLKRMDREKKKLGGLKGWGVNVDHSSLMKGKSHNNKEKKCANRKRGKKKTMGVPIKWQTGSGLKGAHHVARRNKEGSQKGEK